MPEHAKRETDAKVVHLEPENQRIVRAKLAKLPAAVHSVHEKGRFLVLGLLKSFFDRADDSLFELADKAQSNQEQNLYFDSMREVRVQRRGIEKRFADAIDNAFADLTGAQASPPGPASEEYNHSFSPDALSLVDNEELEEMVAVDASVARANTDHGEAIQLISLRLDSLLPVKVYQKNNPLGPDVLCAAFMTEVKKLDVGIKAKLVLFKLFDKAVVGKLGEVYRAANEIFKENNVLPSLSPANQHRRRRSDVVGDDRRSAPGAPGEGVEASHVSPEVISTLQNLLADKSGNDAEAASKSKAAANELIQLLSRAQQMPSVMESPAAINVRDLISELQGQAGSQSKIGQVDDQVMNLVNLLFDFILEDRNLAPQMKAVISRMQIPIIKVAVADKSFFTKGGHVARRLLNEMATAAIGWQGTDESCARDPLYKKIESIVRKLIEEFNTDLDIFSELLADFSAFLEKEKKRAAVLERRTIDAEDGKAKAEIARTTVALEIELRTINHSLPVVVDHLIKDAWSNVLFVTALKYGYESQEWQTQLNVLEALVWSVRPPRTIEQRQKLIKIVPSLLKKLRSGLDTISYNPFEMSDLFKSLEKVHIACIRGKLQQPKQPAKKAAQEPSPAKEQVSAAASPAEQQKESPAENSKPTTSSVRNTDNQTATDSAVSTAAPAQSDTTANTSAPQHLPEDDPYMKQVSAFVQGAWFNMKNDQGENMRCRLAAFIKPTGKYIFVNRNGMKVAENTQVELALALKNSRLSALDNSMLFDRALETVVSSLRKN